MVRPLRIFLLVVSLTAAYQSLSAAAELDFKLDAQTLSAPGNNEVKFRQISQSLDDPIIDLSHPIDIAATDDDGRYSVALVDIARLQNQRFFTYKFVVWARDNRARQNVVVVNVSTTGSFPDFEQDLKFRIANARGEPSNGTIKIPIHSVDPASVCKVVGTKERPLPTAASPLPVFLGGPTPYTVLVDCSDSALLPTIVRIDPPNKAHNYWAEVTYESQYYSDKGQARQPIVKMFDLMTVTLTPDALKAVRARLRRVSLTDAPDDTITVDVTYAIQQGGTEVPLRVEIPVTFFPSASVIVGSLMGGSFTGWVLSWLLLAMNGRGGQLRKMPSLGLGFVLAGIAFIVLLLAFNAKCKVEIFGVESNPFDVAILLVVGLASGVVASLKTIQLQKVVDKIAGIVLGKTKAAATPAILLGVCLLPHPAIAESRRLDMYGLSTCADGTIIGLRTDRTVVSFSAASTGQWRPVGVIDKYLRVVDLVCADVGGKKTVFVAADSAALGNIQLLRMDVATGKWQVAVVGRGVAGGIAYDADGRSVFLMSLRSRSVLRVPSTLEGASEWTVLINSAESVGSLMLDRSRKRLLLGEGFSGTVLAVDLATKRQQLLVEGVGSANSLAIDPRQNRLYVADEIQSSVWMMPLDGSTRRLNRFVDLRKIKQSTGFDAKHATGVAVDGQSNVWVGFSDAGRVLVFGLDGRLNKVIQ